MSKGQVCDEYVSVALENGAVRAAVIDAAQVRTDPVFRDMCQANACGMYGKCYMCPPDVGDADALAARLKEYDRVLVYQTVSPLEDSYDFQNMTKARAWHCALSQRLRAATDENALHLSVGGCGVCKRCAKEKNLPCVAPERAMASLEAYTIDAAALAKAAGMPYTNGENTVTYFGAIFFKENEKW